MEEVSEGRAARLLGARDPSPPPQLTEADWSLQELRNAIRRMKANKASDECGLVAELLHFAPENVWCTILN